MSNNIGIVASNAWYVLNFRKELIAKLASEYDTVFVLVGFDGYEDELEKIDRNIRVINSSLDRKSTNIISNFKLLYFYYSFFKTHNVRCVVNFTIKPNIFSGLVCKFMNIPYINNVTGLGTVFIDNGLLKNIVVFLYRLAFPSAMSVIFQNEDDLKLLKEEGISDHNFKLIEGSGVDTDVIISSSSRPSTRDYSFLFIGRILKDKGILEFIEASKNILEKYPNIKIGIVGNIDIGNKSGISELELKKLIDGTSIHYFGFSKDVKSLMNNSKSLVLPSYREGLSRVLIEAASMNCVLLASDVPGCRQVLDNDNGLLFEPRSIDSLIIAMEKFINLEPSEIDLMGKRSRDLAITRFSTKVINKSFLEVLNRK